MCKIIPFPKQESTGYQNLKIFFGDCEKVASCEFYLGVAETLFKDSDITQIEIYTLRRIGRQKRQKLVEHEESQRMKKVTSPAEPGIYSYTTEIGEKEPEGSQMEATRKL